VLPLQLPPPLLLSLPLQSPLPLPLPPQSPPPPPLLPQSLPWWRLRVDVAPAPVECAGLISRIS
jgi:hypothetical protein